MFEIEQRQVVVLCEGIQIFNWIGIRILINLSCEVQLESISRYTENRHALDYPQVYDSNLHTFQ